MTAVGRRFGSRVSTWSIWNEPNHPQFLGPQYRRGKAYSPRLYRRLFQAAHRALDATGNRRDRVLMGETAPRGNSNVVHPLRFLRGSLCLSAAIASAAGAASSRPTATPTIPTPRARARSSSRAGATT